MEGSHSIRMTSVQKLFPLGGFGINFYFMPLKKSCEITKSCGDRNRMKDGRYDRRKDRKRAFQGTETVVVLE